MHLRACHIMCRHRALCASGSLGVQISHVRLGEHNMTSSVFKKYTSAQLDKFYCCEHFSTHGYFKRGRFPTRTCLENLISR